MMSLSYLSIVPLLLIIIQTVDGGLLNCCATQETATPKWTSCSDNSLLEVMDIQLPVYPIDLTKAVPVKISYVNHGGVAYDNLRGEAHLSYYGKFLLSSCQWQDITPEISLLIDTKNIDGCSYIPKCPLSASADLQTVETSIDLTSYAGLLNFLAGNCSYDLKVIIKDSTGNQLACIDAKTALK